MFSNSDVLYFEGEPFTQEEMDEMLSAAVDPDKNVILYKDFVSMMTFDDTRWLENKYFYSNRKVS